MTTLQAFALGFMVSWTASLLLRARLLWRDDALKPLNQDRPEILPEILEDRLAADLRYFANHVKDTLTSPEDMAARLRLIGACKIVLRAVGFTVVMNRVPVTVEDEVEGEAPNGDAEVLRLKRAGSPGPLRPKPLLAPW